MASPKTQRPPPASMTTGARGSRFPIAMGNGTEKPQQALPTPFSGSVNWPTTNGAGIWGSAAIGGFGKTRELVGPKDSVEPFPNAPSGSGALASTSEAEPWGSRSGPWNNTEATQTRNASGNTSPSRTRIEAPIHDTNGSSAYYSTAQSQMQGAIGQRGPVRSKATTASDAAASTFSFPQYTDYIGDNEDTSAFGSLKFGSDSSGLNGFAASKRPSQDAPFQSLVGNGSRDPGMPTSSHSETDLHAQANSFGDLAYGGHTPNSVHSQRPSMSSFSQSGRGFSSHGLGQQLDRDEIQAKFSGMALNDGQSGAGNGMNGLASYGNGSSNTQFNPQSQPWGPTGQGFPAEFQKDMFTGSLGYEKRGSVADRSSPAGSITFRAPGLSSPKSYASTPQPSADLWPRPASRDPRNGAETERRGHGQQYMHQQQGPFYPAPYFNGGYSQYPPHLFDGYNPAFRHPMPMAPGYGLSVHPYLAAGVAPIRPGKDQDPAKGMRSPLLEEFRATSKSSKRWELKHIYGYIVEFSGDQHGSRFIQEKLETANSDEKDQVFREIEPNAVQLMKDVFGNYVIQKFFEHGNQVQKKVLASAMRGKVIDLSLQMYACRVVQKALEHVLVEQQAELVRELEVDILKVVKEQNGNHVVQKIIELVPRQHIDFIMNCFEGRVEELSSHTYGCRVIQRVLEHGTEADKTAIMGELHRCALKMIKDQYGNYVTQHVIQHGKPEDRSKIIAIVTSDLMNLSKHKFASNVVEKCIESGTPEELRRIREGLSVPGDDLNSPLPLLIKDQYGNYVVQKLLNQLQDKEREAFADVIKPHVIALKKANPQRQISAIERMVNALAIPASATQGPASKDPTPSSTTRTSPVPPVDGSTPPVLTPGQNSPSSSPPSTDDGAVGEATGATVKYRGAKLPGKEAASRPHAGIATA